jgi:hypothetical protein
VGADYPNKRGPARRFEIALCKPGEKIVLRPEPKNAADPFAIAVFSARDVQLGYLTAEKAPRIGRLLREAEVAAVFQAATTFGAWIRIAFDGTTLDLPRQLPPESDPDWWPDEIPPDF